MIFGNVSLVVSMICVLAMVLVIAVNWSIYKHQTNSTPFGGIIELIALIWLPIILVFLAAGIILRQVAARKLVGQLKG